MVVRSLIVETKAAMDTSIPSPFFLFSLGHVISVFNSMTSTTVVSFLLSGLQTRLFVEYTYQEWRPRIFLYFMSPYYNVFQSAVPSVFGTN
jgi:hypothetical protein